MERDRPGTSPGAAELGMFIYREPTQATAAVSGPAYGTTSANRARRMRRTKGRRQECRDRDLT